MASHSSILAWESLWIEEPGSLVRGVAKSQKWLSNCQHRTQQNKDPSDIGLVAGFLIPLGAVVSTGLGVWSLFYYPLTMWPRGMLIPCFFFKFMQFILLLSFYFILEYSWLTMLWYFEVDRKGTQAYIYIYPFYLKLPSSPGCHITLSRVPCAYTVGPCWLFILNIPVCTCPSQTL